MSIMSNINHPNIIHLYKTFEENNSLYFVYEYFPSTDLESYVKDFKKNNPNKYINQDIVIKILKQILLGLQYLHNCGIFHRDIKPASILIDTNYNVKITSFDLSAFYKQGFGILSSNCTFVGQINYVCPEILNKQPYDYKCDIFTLGYTMHFVMNFILPTKTDVSKGMEKISRIQINTINNNYNPQLIQLIKKMYNDNPSERPDATQCLQELELMQKNIAPINPMNSVNNLNQIHNDSNQNINNGDKIEDLFPYIHEPKKVIKFSNINTASNGNYINDKFLPL